MRTRDARLLRMNDRVGSPGADAGKPALKERVRRELREYAIAAGYLFVGFAAVAFYKAAVLESHGVRILPFGIALTKALILGKFLLIIGAVGTRTGLHARPWLRSVPVKTVACFLSLLVLLVIEEALVGWLKGHSVAQVLAEHKDRSASEMLAECLLLLLMLFPLIAANQFRHIEGEDALGNLLRGTRSGRPD